jgi:hypothetical protein
MPSVSAVSPVFPFVPVATAQVAAALFEHEVAGCKPRDSAYPAFSGNVLRAAENRPHRLTNSESERCHAPCWDDAEIAAFTARTERFAQRGRADADDLAEQLTLRDRDGDDRRLCLECVHLSGRRCGAWRRAGMGGPVLPTSLLPLPQRCAAFNAGGSQGGAP